MDKVIMFWKCAFCDMKDRPLNLSYFTGIHPSMWIGLQKHKWLSGENFVNIFGSLGVFVQLNDYDRKYPNARQNYCGALDLPVLPFPNRIIDFNCNIRQKWYFICEII